MALGEFIAETGLRIFLEIVFHGFAYWTGFIVLKVLSFGTLALAPLATLGERNRGKKKIDRGIWLHRPAQGKALKAEVTCVAGIACWIALAFAIHAAIGGTAKAGTSPSPAEARPQVQDGWKAEASGPLKSCSPGSASNRSAAS